MIRRLCLPMPLSSRSCRCDRLLDSLGHHRAGRRGFALECSAAQVFREAGLRVSTNVMMRDLDILGPHAAMDGRRLEVIADGLPLFNGAQLALDTNRGVSFAQGQDARRRKERTYPELNGARGRACLAVLAAEVGGRWSDETAQFLRALAKHRTQGAPGVMRQRVQSAWLRLGQETSTWCWWCAMVVLLEQGTFSFFCSPLDCGPSVMHLRSISCYLPPHDVGLPNSSHSRAPPEDPWALVE